MSVFAHAMSPFLRVHLALTVVLTSVSAMLVVGAISNLGVSPFGLDEAQMVALLLKAVYLIALPQQLLLLALLLCTDLWSGFTGRTDRLSPTQGLNCLLLIPALTLLWVIIGHTLIAAELHNITRSTEDLMWTSVLVPLIPMFVHFIVMLEDSQFNPRPQPLDELHNGIV